MGATQQRLFDGGRREPEPLTVVSYGGGQDSSAILLRLLRDGEFRQRWAPRRLMAVMSDTGDEHPQTLDYVSRMRELCESEGVEFHFLEAGGEFHSAAWQDLISHYRRNDTVGSKAFPKSCSANLKPAVIYRFLEAKLAADYGVRHNKKQGLYDYVALTGQRITMILGIAAGEEGRLAKDDSAPAYMRRTIERRYPLVEDGWDRERCKRYILSTGHDLPIPSLCRRCPFKRYSDLALMEREDPEGLAEWIDLERAKLDSSAGKFPDLPPEKNFGVFGAKSLEQALEEAREQYGHLSYEELHELRMAGHNVRSRY